MMQAYGQRCLELWGRCHLRVFAILLVLAFLLPVSAFAQSSPLIMKHADHLSVARKKGSLLLEGRVFFVHDSVRFRTQRATWNKDAEIVNCDGGFLFTHPSGFIQAQSGIYRKKQGLAIAMGDVVAGDSAGSYKFTGEFLEYDRENEILTMPQKPKLYQYEKHRDGGRDTLTIEANRIIYNKKASFAEAYKNVKVTQSDMVVTCDTGYFDRANSWLSLKGHPTFDMKNYHLTGDSIYLTIDETKKTLTSALVIRNAHGISKEEPKKNAPGNVTEAFGDTLFCEFKDNKIERLYVNLNAKGFFYETDLPDYRNLMDGNRLDLFFKKGKMDHAIVSGKAQSTYFYVKKDRTVSGKNEAAGDTINIVFDPLKNAVKTLRLLGRSTIASGRYVDLEKEQRQKAEKEKALRDSLAKAGVPDSLGLTKPRVGNDKAPARKPSAIRPSMNKMLKRAKETKKKEEGSP
jgi:lipopolysaccharide export system protein LptA